MQCSEREKGNVNHVYGDMARKNGKYPGLREWEWDMAFNEGYCHKDAYQRGEMLFAKKR